MPAKRKCFSSIIDICTEYSISTEYAILKIPDSISEKTSILSQTLTSRNRVVFNYGKHEILLLRLSHSSDKSVG